MSDTSLQFFASQANSFEEGINNELIVSFSRIFGLSGKS